MLLLAISPGKSLESKVWVYSIPPNFPINLIALGDYPRKLDLSIHIMEPTQSMVDLAAVHSDCVHQDTATC